MTATFPISCTWCLRAMGMSSVKDQHAVCAECYACVLGRTPPPEIPLSPACATCKVRPAPPPPAPTDRE